MTLPAGMTVSPSAADGLQACSNAQFGLGTEFGPRRKTKKAAEEQTEHFVEAPPKPASCPLASQIGTVEVFTPLLSGAPTIQGVPRQAETDVLAGHVERQPDAPSNPVAAGRCRHRRCDRQRHTAPAEEPLAKEDEGKAIQCQVTATQRRRQLCRREPGRCGPRTARTRQNNAEETCRTRHRSRRRASPRRAGPRRRATR